MVSTALPVIPQYEMRGRLNDEQQIETLLPGTQRCNTRKARAILSALEHGGCHFGSSKTLSTGTTDSGEYEIHTFALPTGVFQRAGEIRKSVHLIENNHRSGKGSQSSTAPLESPLVTGWALETECLHEAFADRGS